MPAALDVDREAVRVLAVAVGVREAARQMGLGESTVQQWSARGNWFTKPVQPPTVIQPVTNVTKPALALQNTLDERKHTTKLNLSKYVVDASARGAKSNGDLHKAGLIRHVAAIAQVVWPEAQVAAVNIALLNGELGMG